MGVTKPRPKPGHPRFRPGNAGKEWPAADNTEADVTDLEGKTAVELKEIAERDALKALIAQTRRPTRHATAVVSAAGKLLDFSSAKPAQKIETDNKTQLTGTIEIELVRAADGREIPNT